MSREVADRKRAEEALQKRTFDLGERVKELNCLYGISKIIEDGDVTEEETVRKMLAIIPPAWQYPEVTCARTVIGEREFRTNNFMESAWMLSAPITVSGSAMGRIDVGYREEMPEEDEGPFLKEERLLINAVAERTGKIIDRLRATQQLEIERNALQESNIAMRQLMGRIREEKAEIGAAVQSNVDKIVLPIVDALDQGASAQQSRYLSLLRRNLEEIASPFADRLSRAFLSLTPMEIRICNMVRRNLTTKQIARLQGISPATVSHHREHIRRKLKLTSANINLATYLDARMSQGEGVPASCGL